MSVNFEPTDSFFYKFWNSWIVKIECGINPVYYSWDPTNLQVYKLYFWHNSALWSRLQKSYILKSFWSRHNTKTRYKPFWDRLHLNDIFLLFREIGPIKMAFLFLWGRYHAHKLHSLSLFGKSQYKLHILTLLREAWKVAYFCTYRVGTILIAYFCTFGVGTIFMT